MHFFKTISTLIIAAGSFLLICVSSCVKKHEHDKKIFRYNETTGIASLDPAFAKNQSIMWAVHQLYSTLLETDSNLNIKPLLAERYEISADRKVLKFFLRSGVRFHDDACFPKSRGRLLVAADVVYSFSRIINSAAASPGSWIFNSRVDSLMPFSAIGDSVFVLRLAAPFQPVLGMLTMQYCSIVPREAVEYYGNDFRRHPVGSGPFQFTAWDEGRALILKKNDHYFETDSSGIRLPYIDGIHVSFHESKAAEFLEFRQGKIDFINDIDPSFKDELLTKTGNLKSEWQDILQLQKHPYLNIEYLGILADTNNALLKNSPLKNTKIRQAINYSIDRKKMMLYLRNSVGIAAEHGFIPPALHGSRLPAGYAYDPAKAQQLLQEAGFPGGKNLPGITLLSIPVYANLASYIANDLKQQGFMVKVEIIQKSLLLEQTAKSQALFFRGSWIADYPDAENYLGVFYGKNPAPPNYTRFKNDVFDDLYERAAAETGVTEREKIFYAMDSLIVANAPVVPLWYDMVLHLLQKNVSGFTPNALNLMELRRVKKTLPKVRG